MNTKQMIEEAAREIHKPSGDRRRTKDILSNLLTKHEAAVLERVSQTWFKSSEEVEMRHGLIRKAEYRIKLNALQSTADHLRGE